MKKKKLTLKNSYFKKKQQNDPDTITEIVSYFKEHGELPFICESENWIYDVMIERQKQRGKIIGQVMTPDAVAERVSLFANKYKTEDNTVLDACCGTGQITRQLLNKGFTVSAFDLDDEMIFAHNFFHPECKATKMDFRDMDGKEQYNLIVSNPPFGVVDLKLFFTWLHKSLSGDGVAILILPKEFIDKKRPKELAQLLSKFKVIEREKVNEKFPLTTELTEIVIIELTEKEKEMKKNFQINLPAIIESMESNTTIGCISTEENTDNSGTLTDLQETSESEIIHQVELNRIDPSPYNPRIYYKEVELHELAASIKKHKLIQPITLRKKADGRYEIICGERRFRASIIAGLTYISAVVREYKDSESMEVTIIENLEREDLSPIEEANSYANLMEVLNYSIEDLTIRFDKSESTIRGRLQLRNLIEEISMMVIKNEISLGNAMELSKYNQDMQKAIYKDHLDEDNFANWRELPTKSFIEKLSANYSSDLNSYTFDKTACKGCVFHSATFDLFAQDGEFANCQNRTCLDEKQKQHIVKATIEIAAKEKDVEICVVPYKSNIVSDVKSKISEMGFDVTEKQVEKLPEPPQAPNKDDFNNEEKYQNAKIEYEEEYADYAAKMEAIENKIAEGEAVKVIDISNGLPKVSYRLLTAKETAKRNENPINLLKDRDKRNKVIALEKTVDGVKEFIRDDKTVLPDTPLDEKENDLLIYILMTKLRPSNMKRIGLKFIGDEDCRAKILPKLKENQKNIIVRDFIASHLSETFGVKKQSELLLQFVSLHFPEEVATIQKTYDDNYEKQHQSTLKRIEELEKIANAVNGGVQKVDEPIESLNDSIEQTEEYIDIDSDITVYEEEEVPNGVDYELMDVFS